MELSSNASDVVLGSSILIRAAASERLIRIRWYGEALSQNEMIKTIRSAIDVEDRQIQIFDENTGAEIINGSRSLRDLDTVLTVRVVNENERIRLSSIIEFFNGILNLLIGKDTDGLDNVFEKNRRISSEWQDQHFQGQIIKFERILSHLASERTVLAWLRAALTMIAQALAIWQLKSAANQHLKSYLSLVACIYFVFVPIIIFLSLRRWIQMKRILTLKDTDVQLVLNAVNLSFQSVLLLGICLAAAFTFVVVGSDDAVFADFRPSNFIDT